MRRAFPLTCAVYAALVAASAWWLPERVPLHFGLTGEPDRWGSRTEALVTFAAIGLVLAGVMALSLRAVRRLSLRSPWVNLPHRDWWTATPEREARARARLLGDLQVLSAGLMALLCLVLLLTVRAARADDHSLGGPGLLLAASAVVLVGWAMWTTVWRFRPEEDR